MCDIVNLAVDLAMIWLLGGPYRKSYENTRKSASWEFGYGKFQSFVGLTGKTPAKHKEIVREQATEGIWLWKNIEL